MRRLYNRDIIEIVKIITDIKYVEQRTTYLLSIKAEHVLATEWELHLFTERPLKRKLHRFVQNLDKSRKIFGKVHSNTAHVHLEILIGHFTSTFHSEKSINRFGKLRRVIGRRRAFATEQYGVTSAETCACAGVGASRINARGRNLTINRLYR